MPDNASDVSAAADGAIRVWKPAAVRIFTGHEGPIHTVAAHPNGSQVTTGSADKSVKVFDLNNGNLIRSLAGHSDAVRAVVVSGDGTRVVTAGNDRTVRFWNAGDGNNVLVLPGLPAPVLSLAARSDSKLAAAGLEDGSTRVFDLTATDAAKAERQAFTPGAGAGPIAAVAFLAEPLALLTGGGDRSVKLWTVIAPGAGRTLSGHGNQVYSVAWSPDGKQLATGAADKTVRQWDVAKLTQVRKLNAHANVVYTVAYSPKGDLLATGGDDKLITHRCAKRLTFAELQPGLGEERTDQLGLLTQTTDRKV